MRAFAASEERVFFKHDYPPEAVIAEGITPNVLFFLESSTAMMFAPWGLIPTVNDKIYNANRDIAVNSNDYRVLQYKVSNLQHDTFGSGMRNVMFGTESENLTQEQWASLSSTGTAVDSQVKSVDGKYRLVEVGIQSPNPWNVSYGGGFSRMGRDLDASNNIIGDPTCYYSVFPDKPYFLTFRNRLLAWHDWKNNPNPISFPATAVANENVAALNSYNAIKDYMPGGGLAGRPVPLVLANVHLVPNDSRIYKLKLALWHLLDEKNAEKFSKINVGIAQIYKSYMNTSWNSYVYHGHGVSNTNVNTMAVSGDWRYYGAWMNGTYGNPSGTVNAPYGSGSFFIVGVDSATISNYPPNQQAMGQMVKYDISNWGGDTNPDTDTRFYARSWSRALLTLPFDKLYEMRAGQPKTTLHFDSIKRLIDGMERYPTDMNQSVSTYKESAIPNNQEIFAIGANFVATGLYGGRTTTPDANLGKTVSGWTTGAAGVYHQDKLSNSQSLIQYANDNDVTYNDGTIFLKKTTNSEGLQAGQAAGSVIDFFSPPTGASYSNGLKFDNDTKGFFPVKGSCQQNWVVLFVSGNEALKGFSQKYTIAKAALKLFQNTLTMRGREWKNDQWSEKTYTMDSGVRTIIVGIVDGESDDAKDLKKDLEEAAKAGDPVLQSGGNPTNPAHWHANPNAKPYLVKDVNDLDEALDAILRRIALGSSGGGAPVSLPDLENISKDGSRTVFGASYKIVRTNDQWEAWMQRTDIDLNGNEVKSKGWQADEELKKASREGTNRNLYTWTSGTQLAAVSAANLQSNAGVPSSHGASFDKWLREFDVKNPPLDGSIGLLGDMPRSNILVVGAPKASGMETRGFSVYAQTNRGVLHRFDYNDGKEKWGFIPPNIFENKLKYMKFDSELKWLDGQPALSQPMILLDGKLIARDVRFNAVAGGTTYKTVLTGYLGRGGNGFYTMDVTETNGNEPKFLWAIENKPDGVEVWNRGTGNYGYGKLGLTIVPGVFITPEGKDSSGYERDVGVLPGGLGYKLGKNGDTQGKAFYVFDPEDGKILNKMENISGDAVGTLGMGVTPVVYRYGGNVQGEKSLRKTVSFYTADSNGNILCCDTAKQIGSWELERVFKLTTIAVSDDFEKVPKDLSIVIPHAMSLVGLPGGYRQDEWLFGGTMNIAGPGSESLFSGDKTIVNPQQFIFGLNLANLAVQKATDRNMNILVSRDYYSDGIKPEYPKSKKTYKFDEALKERNSNGWYLKLRPAVAGNASNPQGTDPEYVSAPPYLFNDCLYVPTFVPYAGTNEDRTCQNVGVGKLYVLSPSTGFSMLNDRAAIEMMNIKIVGFSGTGSRLALSVQELKAGARDDFVDTLKEVFKNGSVIDSIKGIVEIDALGESIFPASISPDIPQIQYWREKFR